MRTSSRPVIDLAGVSFRRNGREIIHDVNFTVRRGEHWAMLGPNGAGKSTLLGFCSAESFPTTGTVDVLGNRLGRVDVAQLRRRIGHVNPRHGLRSPLTTTQVVLTGMTGTIDVPMRWAPTPEQEESARSLLEQLGLGSVARETWPTLSQGERGRALVARALAGEPELLLLDEPATGLDVAAREQLLSTLDVVAHTHPVLASVLVTHHLEELPGTTSHAVLVSEGTITRAGSAAQVLDSASVSAAFHHPIEVERRGGRWSARAAGVAAVTR